VEDVAESVWPTLLDPSPWGDEADVKDSAVRPVDRNGDGVICLKIMWRRTQPELPLVPSRDRPSRNTNRAVPLSRQHRQRLEQLSARGFVTLGDDMTSPNQRTSLSATTSLST
jgi:hypothetical protein